MFDLYYNRIKAKCGSLAKPVLFSDTDSLARSTHNCSTFLNIPQIISSTTLKRKKSLESLKTRRMAYQLKNLLACDPRCIHYFTDNIAVEKKVAKRIAKHITKQKIRYEHYKQYLFRQEQQMASMKQLRSFQHNIFSIKLNKIGLSPFDKQATHFG